MRYVSQKDKMPTEAHYAVIVYGTVYIPGDERSRTNPGHGYGEHTESKIDYIAFQDNADLQEWLKRNHTNNNFSIVEVKPKSMEVKTTFDIK